ncbi:MAG: VWA domain-containing protein [Treponema sp.]|jgi:hypothetical protein|nr:VWA domain-containing protein [Treponema sp.]
MPRFLVVYAVLALAMPRVLFSEGNAQGSQTSPRSPGYSELHEVLPPQAIQIAEYISRGAYNYPLQETGPVQVFSAADIRDTTGYLQLGFRATHSLPPLNIAFVIDKSRSMEELGRMDWVKNAFQHFMDQVRPEDVVSLVSFDTSAKVIIPPVSMKTPQSKQHFMDLVASLKISGRSDIYEGMALGYTQVAANYRKGYINRVICLTDGGHNAGDKGINDIVSLVETYHNQDITLSTVALGESADLSLMEDTALIGGGSFRFISDAEEMAETFGSALDRLVVPGARLLNVDIRLAQGVGLQETWGYGYQVSGATVHYSLGTLYNEETKTLVAEVQIHPQLLRKPGDIPLGTVYLEYLDQYDVVRRQGPYPVVLEASRVSNQQALTQPWIQEAEGFIRLGQGLIHLGNQAIAINTLKRVYDNLKRHAPASPDFSRIFNTNNNGLVPFVETTEEPLYIAKDRLLQQLKDALQEIEALTAYLEDIRDTLGPPRYEAELGLLTQYHAAFSRMYTDIR